MRCGKTRNWRHRNGAGRNDPERALSKRSTPGGGAKSRAGDAEVSRFAEGLGRERRPRRGGHNKLIVMGERKAGSKRGLRLLSAATGLEVVSFA